MGRVINCHWVTRALTKPWEASNRDLHFYDLATDTLGRKSSRNLFARAHLNTQEIEGRLNKFVEDVVAKYRDGRAPDPRSEWRTFRALVGLVALQGQRAHEALSTNAPTFKLEDLLNGEGALDVLVSQFNQSHNLFVGTIPAEEWLFYPSTGTFSFPVAGHRPGIAVPITPRTFVALVERGALMDHVTAMVRTRCQLSVFSGTGSGLEQKLVIPAYVAEQMPAENLLAWVRTVRDDGKRLYNLHGHAARVAGLPAFGYSDHPSFDERGAVPRRTRRTASGPKASR